MNMAQICSIVIWAAGGFIAGVIVEKIVFAQLKKIALKTKWEADEIVISSLKWMPSIWFTIAGLSIGIHGAQLSPVFIKSFDKGIVVVIIVSVTLILSRIVSGMTRVFAKKAKGSFPSTSIFTHISTVIIFVTGVLIILQWLNIPITPVITALGLGGFAVALALRETLTNLFAGIEIVASGKVRPGDYIKVDSGEEGYVVDIAWRSTTVRAIHNNVIIIPNAKLASAITINFNLPQREMALRVEVGVSYDSDLRKVEKVTIETAKEILNDIKGGAPEFEPFIRYHTFGDSSINFTVIMYVKEFFSQYVIKHEFVKRLHERYNEEGIEIPFPIRTVYMKENKEQIFDP